MRMNKFFLVLSAAALGALAQPCPLYGANAAAPGSRAPRLEGMTYAAARRIILSYGWRPAPGPCGGLVSASVCARFPEIEACSCCDRAPCALLFIRGNRCLTVGTEGDWPDSRSTYVTDVSFRRHHCSKPPS
jgi:hypothetical protein